MISYVSLDKCGIARMEVDSASILVFFISIYVNAEK